MGYETRLYVAKKTSIKDKHYNDRYWAEMIASYNLCKVPDFASWATRQPETDCYIYVDGCDDGIYEDNYGDVMTEMSLKDTITHLEKCMNEDDFYRRWYPVVQMLKAFYEQEQDGYWGKGLVVLHYGY